MSAAPGLTVFQALIGLLGLVLLVSGYLRFTGHTRDRLANQHRGGVMILFGILVLALGFVGPYGGL